MRMTARTIFSSSLPNAGTALTARCSIPFISCDQPTVHRSLYHLHTLIYNDMLSTSLTSLLLLLAHLSGSSAKFVQFGNANGHLLAARALRRSVDTAPSSNASGTSTSAGGNLVVPAGAADAKTNDDWNGIIDLSAPPPSDLTESLSDIQADEEWCKKQKVRCSLPADFATDWAP
jgi:hypothetical protein